MQAALAALEAGRATTRDPGFSFYDRRRPLLQETLVNTPLSLQPALTTP
jgi:hypothetical protein